MVNRIFWEFTLVTRSFEKIRVLRTREGRPANVHGTYPRNFSCFLMLGDRVYVKYPGQHWRLKFKLMTHPTRGYPVIRYGWQYGPFPKQYRALNKLSPAAFKNAGIDPTWITQPKRRCR